MSSWLIGTLSLLLNGIIQVRSIYTIKQVKTSSALADKVLITLISFGDWLVGGYHLSLAVIDIYFGSSFCLKQFDWLLSSSCSILGVVSTIGSQTSLFSMTVLSISRLDRISKGLSIPGPVNERCCVLAATITLFILGSSVSIAVIPLLPLLEDTFVNALYLPEIDFLRGFTSKRKLAPTLASYYGRIRLEVSSLSWTSLRSLISGMFTNNYEGISQRFLGFYGNESSLPVQVLCFAGRTTNNIFLVNTDSKLDFLWSNLNQLLDCFYHYVNIIFKSF